MVDVLGKIIDWIPSAIKSRLISKEERKQKHLDDIKKEVLKPMVDSLTLEVTSHEYYLDEPLRAGYIHILEGKAPLIYVAGTPAFVRGIKVTEDAWKFEHKLAVLKPELSINENLYSDIKQHHYKELVQNWEEFINGFESYANDWLAYANDIRETIERELELPIYNGDSDGYFVNSHPLAVYAIERIMGLNPMKMRIENENQLMITSITGTGWQIAMRAQPEKIQRCIELIDKLIESDVKTKELNAPAKKLLESANSLRNEIDRIIKTYELPGKCEYV